MTFWIPRGSSDPNTYRLPIGAEACVGPEGSEFVMGGVIVGAIADALQRATGKPLLWVTSQFVAAGRLGDEITIKLDLP